MDGWQEAAAALAGPPLPVGAEYLEEMFMRIHAGRSMGGMGGASPLTHADLAHARANYGWPPYSDLELAAIRGMDSAYLDHVVVATLRDDERDAHLSRCAARYEDLSPALARFARRLAVRSAPSGLSSIGPL
ncbi:MAG TPA: hypothetical protein VEA99_09815 [Gemmatimonadaceae bacterium]|nr:hypothetical protein [Gemmatimonadaceae bacterium]